jgi:LmbE family N-acetylglucosaminyl deacetylase
MKRVLFIGAHCDDIELGCGGYIHSQRGQIDPYALVLSNQNRQGVTLTTRSQEALTHLGLPVTQIRILEQPVSQFYTREALWTQLRAAANWAKPQLTFTHERDNHSHHVLVHQECLNAALLPRCELATYTVKPYLDGMVRNWYHTLTEADLEAKLQALKIYDNYADLVYFQPELIRAWARVCGFNSATMYAEAFQLERHYTE